MEIVVALTAFVASLLTLYSGFGLGTILMPVAAIFFPVTVAVAMTAFVHLLNNLFKLAVLRRKVGWPVVAWFGLPAMLATVPGAWLLARLDRLPAVAAYELGGISAVVSPVKLVVGFLLIVFATAEWLPLSRSLALSRRALPVGGLLSGFFGGLSGHQGAFRSAFLLRAGLDVNSFVATNAAIAALVDVTRLAVYGLNLELIAADVDATLLAATTAAALAGVIVGTIGLAKVTIGFVRALVAILLYALGLLLAAGLI